MAKFNDPIVVRGARNVTLGSIIGTRVSRSTFDDAERDGHRVFFGGRFDDIESSFEDRFIRPLDLAARDLERVANRLVNPDKWRHLETIEDFMSIPPCMELMIVQTPSVRDALREGRVDGFGYDPDTLPDDDYYGRMADNYRCDNVRKRMDEHGRYQVSARHKSTDADMDADTKHLVWKTRRAIDRIMSTTERDPTDITTLRG